MQRYNILWADDEIELLKAHIMFLEEKGYNVTPVNSAVEALESVDESNYDVVFLDENMPGMSGLEALNEIKKKFPSIPCVMITKSEEEYIMEEAIGGKISDYLIKPLNPNQILLSLKKILDKQRLVSEKTNASYQRDFQQISMTYNDVIDHDDWVNVYKKLIHHEIGIEETEHKSMKEVLEMQKSEANSNFCRFVEDNYEDWINRNTEERPVFSHELMDEYVFPLLEEGDKVFFIVVDNLRFDQYRVLEPFITDYFNIESEEVYYSILPTTTAYARNAIFSGLTPLEMSKMCKDIWKSEEDEGGKNNHEEEFLLRQIDRKGLPYKASYNKVLNVEKGNQLVESFNNLMGNDLNCIVYNFVDMLSHARTDMAMIKELAGDEAAYRTLTKSWFLHSPFYDILKKIAETDAKVLISTDHGTIRVKRPHKIIGDRNTNTNLRYKMGRNLNYEGKNIYDVSDPERVKLPRQNMSSSFVFTQEDLFFVYPNNYNHYVNIYKDSFQHGGISMEEMIVPIVTLSPKRKK